MVAKTIAKQNLRKFFMVILQTKFSELREARQRLCLDLSMQLSREEILDDEAIRSYFLTTWNSTNDK